MNDKQILEDMARKQLKQKKLENYDILEQQLQEKILSEENEKNKKKKFIIMGIVVVVLIVLVVVVKILWTYFVSKLEE